MIKKIFALFSVLGLLLAASPAWAVPNLVSATVNPSGQIVNIPSTAVEVADDVFSLGTAVDPQTGKVVEGYAIINPKRGYQHRPGHSKGPGNGGSTCFAYLAKDAKWKTVEPWSVNFTNTRGLTENFVFNNLTSNILKWEDATDGNVGNSSGVDILGLGTTTSVTLVADTSAPDGQNEVYFSDVSTSGAIAVTIVWGIFGGPPWARELVEWDQVYDDVDFNWSSTGEAGKMDFENIANHELGHSVGMGHPDDSCTEETMYRFADFGETKKRDLNTGDIAGVDKLY